VTDALPRTRGPLAALLEERGLRLRRRDGQNFLVEPALADAIVASAGVARHDLVVEIGPGAGALTQPLLASAGLVVAVEIDRGLADLLRERLGAERRLRLVHGDCLDGPDGLHPEIVRAIATSSADGFRRALVVANLPYSVGTEILVRLLELDVPPGEVTAMLQREVAERLTAKVGDDDYGPLAVLASLRAEVRVLRRVPPAAFHPRPEVESVVVRIVPRPLAAPERDAVRAAAALARKAFQRRRKTLSNALSGEATAGAIAAAGLVPSSRPETVPPGGWLALASAVRAGRP